MVHPTFKHMQVSHQVGYCHSYPITWLNGSIPTKCEAYLQFLSQWLLVYNPELFNHHRVRNSCFLKIVIPQIIQVIQHYSSIFLVSKPMVTTGDPPLEPGLFSGGRWTTPPALQWLHEGHRGRRGTKQTATETEVEHLGSKTWTNCAKRA